MERPDLDRMWETFIKIGLPSEISIARVIHAIRFKIYPTISDLRKKKVINWYSFLIHNRKSGVPTTEDDNNLYFHIRLALKKDVKPNDFRESLPNYYVMTRPIKRRLESISGIDKSIIRNEEIEEAWRIIGEQSEWVMNMLNIYKEEIEMSIYPKQISQFLHYYFNMMALSISAECPKCGHIFAFQV